MGNICDMATSVIAAFPTYLHIELHWHGICGCRAIAHRRIAHQDLSLVGQLLTSGHHNFILLFYFIIILWPGCSLQYLLIVNNDNTVNNCL